MHYGPSLEEILMSGFNYAFNESELLKLSLFSVVLYFKEVPLLHTPPFA